MGFLAQFDDFHAQAAAAMGLSDFGPDDYREPMRLLLSDYDRHAHFSAAGAAMISAEIVGKLAGRLLAQQGFKIHPSFAAAPIEKPIIILGMPRTGSTALQRLLCAPADIQALELWLGLMPMPRPPRDSWVDNPVYVGVATAIAHLHVLCPKLRNIHPLNPDRPDECRSALDQTFWSTDMAQTATAPNYGDWCLSTDARFAYRRYRQILSLIAAGDQRRWVLKNPDHIFALDALLDVFPDACIIQTHRELVTSMASVCSLSYEILRLREPGKTRVEHGRATCIWMRALEKAERVRKQADPARFFDLHSEELRADPVASAERIYAYFGLPVTAQARAAWKNQASADPNAGHGEHAYHLEQWGLSPEEIRAQAPAYCERYQRLFGG